MGTISAPPGKAARNQAEKKSGAAFFSVLIGLSLAVAAIAFLNRTKKGPAPAPSHPKARSDAVLARPPESEPIRPDPNAMNGWRYFTWGMREDDVNAVIKAHESVELSIHDNQGEPLIRLMPRMFGDSVPLRPTLHFESGRLASVVLSSGFSFATLRAYERVKDHMTGEIGLPPTLDDGRDNSTNTLRSVWSFPRTTVEIRFQWTGNENSGGPGNGLLLTFKDPASTR